MCDNLTLEESLVITKPSNRRNDNKDMKGTVSLHPACNPKDTTRKISHSMINETYKEKFRDTLKTDRLMISCHNPDNARKLITASSLNQCEGTENIANYHADEAGMNTMN